jgi:aminoglycoside phosphotransferase family enzyme
MAAGPVSSARKLQYLRDPHHYPRGSGGTVRVIETHFAWVFLTARHAYKLKKPMRQRPLDYRTLKRREQGCRLELELNRRLAPQVYLDVVPLRQRADGSLRLGGGVRASGRIVDWLVRMRRLPATRMLDRAAIGDAVPTSKVRELAVLLARFHTTATRRPMGPRTYVARLERRIRVNRRALAARTWGLDLASVARACASQQRFIAEARHLLGPRGRRVAEVHGDLRPEHVCLGPPLCVIDCLEFDRHLRTLDPLEEIAFLALECRLLGAPRLAARLVAAYRQASGDPAPDALLWFYMGCRALNRAKLAAWHLRDRSRMDAGRWRDRARGYLTEALRLTQAARVTLARNAAQRGIRGSRSSPGGQSSSKGANGRPSRRRASTAPSSAAQGRTVSFPAAAAVS